ncbi:M50 family metallopeptidase [Candidatus Marsarchaeota archaeon]|nr:M50 family metallopeptidase [Candidatus Marsarchaeota archaeon]MCL5404927.1 M50 family metallopeptidase [Candidatus Marsarchaeota archaeon]
MAGASPYIGKVYGIPVELHWTFIIMMLIALALSFYLFLIFVLLFACVFLHELAHSVTAKRNNIEVKKIILYPLGGGSMIDLDNIPSKLEFRISLAGPVSSFLLGFAFGALVVFTPAGIVKSLIQLLFLLNILLAVFNILPWFPLDGGRVLRSYLQKKHDFLRATQITVNASNAIIALFIIGTLVFVAVENGYSLLYKEFIVLWDVFIAVFLYGGAKAELQNAYIKEYTKGIKASAALSRNFVFLNHRPKLIDVYKTMLKSHKHIILFMENGKVYVVSRLPQGIIPIAQIRGNERDIASIEVPTIESTAPLFSALSRMQDDNIGLVAVLKGKKILGVLLKQHVESLISLHVSHVMANSKNIKQENK